MSKTMCKSGKPETTDPKYACKKCGARAKKEKHLCKPRKISSPD
jgi:hypothetical protein